MTNGKNLLLKTIVLFSIITSIIFCGVGNIHVTSTTVYAATRGQKEALEDAKSYLKYSSFSKKGLEDQLDYEGYTKKEIKYAIKKCKANWKKEALEEAKSYLKYSSFSKKGLEDQLDYEGYTKKQIKYALKKCKANWKKEALEEAKSYLDYFSFSRDELKNQLEYEGYTSAQIEYALGKVGY